MEEQNQKLLDEYIQNLNSGTIYKNDLRLADAMVIDEFDPKNIMDIT